MKKMSVSGLIYHVEQAGSCFFSKSSMRFFGDTRSNYSVKNNVINGVAVWELYRKKAVKNDLKCSTYFNQTTYEIVFEKK